MRGSIPEDGPSVPAEDWDAATCSGSTLMATVPVQAGVGGLVDLAHAAFADLGGDGIGAEAGAWFERHQSTGTRRLSSSNQLSTTMICG